jgi:uncharacterized membrane protein
MVGGMGRVVTENSHCCVRITSFLSSYFFFSFFFLLFVLSVDSVFVSAVCVCVCMVYVCEAWNAPLVILLACIFHVGKGKQPTAQRKEKQKQKKSKGMMGGPF